MGSMAMVRIAPSLLYPFPLFSPPPVFQLISFQESCLLLPAADGTPRAAREIQQVRRSDYTSRAPPFRSPSSVSSTKIPDLTVTMLPLVHHPFSLCSSFTLLSSPLRFKLTRSSATFTNNSAAPFSMYSEPGWMGRFRFQIQKAVALSLNISVYEDLACSVPLASTMFTTTTQQAKRADIYTPSWVDIKFSGIAHCLTIVRYTSLSPPPSQRHPSSIATFFALPSSNMLSQRWRLCVSDHRQHDLRR